MTPETMSYNVVVVTLGMFLGVAFLTAFAGWVTDQYPGKVRRGRNHKTG